MKIIAAIFLFVSLNVFAQNNLPTTTSTPTASMNACMERGLKCCNKARGKRADKIRAKCEKKYKCMCPASNPVATHQ